MKHLHREFDLKAGEVVEVELTRAANVQLMTSDEYQNYLQGRQYRYYGGYVRQFPLRLEAPADGHWHLVIDLGGLPGAVTGSTGVRSVSVVGSDFSTKS